MTDRLADAAAPGTVEAAPTSPSQLDDDLARVAAIAACECLQHAAAVLRATPSRHTVALAAPKAAAVLSALYHAAPLYGIRPPFNIVGSITGLHAWSMGIGAEPRRPARPETAASTPGRSRHSTDAEDRET